MSQASFDQLAALYRAITITPGERNGVLTIADSAQLEQLQSILGELREFGVSLLDGSSPQALQVGDSVRVQLDDPRIGVGLLADHFDEVLTFPSGRIKEPRFFLLPAQWASSDNAAPELVQRYRLALSFIKLLEESAAYLDKENQGLVYIDEGKFSLPLQYTSECLNSIDIASLQALLDRFGQDTHRAQKLTILAKAVQKISGAHSPTIRFSQLLGTVTDLLKQYDEGYRLFVADFSYEKVLDQMETAKLEELAKIHKTFADVQNQILGIPVATIIVATQLKTTLTVDAVFWVNTAILLGVWVFAILTWLVLRNQLHTLDAIDDEIQRKRKKIESDYAQIKDVVGSIFPKLESRLKTQRLAFRMVDMVVVIGVVMAHMMYVILTAPAQSWLIEHWQSLRSLLT